MINPFHAISLFIDHLMGIKKKDDLLYAMKTVGKHKFKRSIEKVQLANEILEKKVEKGVEKK